MVMIRSKDLISISIRNKDTTYGYEVNSNYLEENAEIVIADVLHRYKQQILERYFKETGGNNAERFD